MARYFINQKTATHIGWKWRLYTVTVNRMPTMSTLKMIKNVTLNVTLIQTQRNVQRNDKRYVE